MNTILTIISGLLVLDIVVIVHEYGHYKSAINANVHAPVFAIGFGPTIWTFKKTKNTNFELKAIPFGGYVRMASNYEGEELEIPDGKNTLEEVSKLKQIWIIAAGAIYNFIFAIILYFIVGLFIGNVQTQLSVDSFDKNYEAYKVMKKYDVIKEVNNKKIENPNMLPLYIKKNNKIVVLRDKKEVTINVEGTLNPKNKKTYLLGIMQKPQKISHTYGLLAAFKYTYNSFKSVIDMQVETLNMLFSGRAKVSDMSGPVGIVRVTGKVVNESKGFKEVTISLINWLCLISIAIGIANLLFFFIPVVDGGRIVLIILSTIFKRDLSQTKIVGYIMQIFIILMIAYFIYITFIDLFRSM